MSHFPKKDKFAECLEFEELPGVLVEEFAFDLFAGREAADLGEDLGALAGFASADDVIAIAPEHQFVLVAIEKGASVVFVTREEVQAGAGGEIAEHIWIIAEEAVGD